MATAATAAPLLSSMVMIRLIIPRGLCANLFSSHSLTGARSGRLTGA